MANYERGYLYKTYDLNVDADVLVDMLADWVNIYFPSSFPIKLKGTYAPGSEEGKYPCQRRVYIDRSTVPAGQEWPEFFAETLYRVDHETRTLIFGVDEGVPNINYFASNEVEDLGNGRSRLAFRARFDLPPGSDVESAIEHTSAFFPMMIKGLEENAPEFIKNRRPLLLKNRRM